MEHVTSPRLYTKAPTCYERLTRSSPFIHPADTLLCSRARLQEGDRVDCDFDRLDLSTNPYLEKNLEFLCNWIDDLSNEQIKFNQYTRNLQRQKQVRTMGFLPWGLRIFSLCAIPKVSLAIVGSRSLCPLCRIVSSR